jgi:hypothetical protein
MALIWYKKSRVLPLSRLPGDLMSIILARSFLRPAAVVSAGARERSCYQL